MFIPMDRPKEISKLTKGFRFQVKRLLTVLHEITPFGTGWHQYALSLCSCQTSVYARFLHHAYTVFVLFMRPFSCQSKAFNKRCVKKNWLLNQLFLIISEAIMKPLLFFSQPIQQWPLVQHPQHETRI